MADRKYFTTSDVAGFCNVTQRTVAQWVKEGKLSVFRTPGHHARIMPQDFIKFLKTYNMPIPPELRSFSQKKKILIVDDDKNIVYTLKRALMIEDGFEIDVAFNGFEAGQKMSVFTPDLLIIDLRMPGLNGLDVIRQIRSDSAMGLTRIVVISAFFEDSIKEELKALDVFACIDKPFSLEALSHVVQEVFG